MAIKSVHLPDGSTVEIDEWLHWPIYSTCEFDQAAAVNMRLFTYVVGQNVPQQGAVVGGARASNESDTNQVARTRMNHDEAFVVFAIMPEYFALDDAVLAASAANTAAEEPAISGLNLARLQRDLLLELFVGADINKPMARAPIGWWGTSVGAPAYPSGDALVAGVRFNYGTQGRPAVGNQRRGQLPILIGSDRVMYARVSSPVGAITGLDQDIRLRVYLDGLKRRPVA